MAQGLLKEKAEQGSLSIPGRHPGLTKEAPKRKRVDGHPKAFHSLREDVAEIVRVRPDDVLDEGHQRVVHEEHGGDVPGTGKELGFKMGHFDGFTFEFCR